MAAPRRKDKAEAGNHTRSRILESARELVLKRKGAEVSMAEIGQAAKISRQAVYLHFADRGDLFVALVQYADEKRGLGKELEEIRNAPSGRAALRAMASLQARTNAKIWPLAKAAESVRRTDSAMERAWQNRLQHRHQGCEEIVKRLASEGSLREGLSVDIATDLLWTITSLRTWEDLVIQRKWKARDYEEYISEVLSRILTSEA